MPEFRYLLNDNPFGEALFVRIGRELQARGIKVNIGTIATYACEQYDSQVLSSKSAWGCAAQ